MANSVLNLAKVKSRSIGHIYNVQVNEELQNGFVGYVGDLVSGEDEIYKLEKFATATIPTKSAVIIYMDEILYDESTYVKKQLGQFSIPANTPAKGYELHEGDVVDISYAGVTLIGADVVEGNYLIPANGSFKLAEVADPTTAKTVLKVEGTKTIGTLQYVGSNGQIGNQYKMIIAKVVSI